MSNDFQLLISFKIRTINSFNIECRMFRHLSKLTRFLQPASIAVLQNNLRNFSAISNIINRSLAPISDSQLTRPLLQPSSLALNFDRGFKQMGRLKRRCKDCYFVMRQERLYVICKTHPRHKQMQMKKKEKNTWILTDATQSPIRAW